MRTYTAQLNPERLPQPTWSLAPESKKALQELASLLGPLLCGVLWIAAFLIMALFAGWWALAVPIFFVGSVLGKGQEEAEKIEAQRISEIRCPYERRHAELLAIAKQIRERQW